MKVMSMPYETGGRSAQKARTRDALVAAARDLVAAGGVTPTVEDAAAAASISRSTAYRYFPNKRALLVAAHPETAATSMLPADPPRDPAARIDAVALTRWSAQALLQRATTVPPPAPSRSGRQVRPSRARTPGTG